MQGGAVGPAVLETRETAGNCPKSTFGSQFLCKSIKVLPASPVTQPWPNPPSVKAPLRWSFRVVFFCYLEGSSSFEWKPGSRPLLLSPVILEHGVTDDDFPVVFLEAGIEVESDVIPFLKIQ